MNDSCFVPKYRLAFTMATFRYNSTFRIEKGKAEQAMKDLDLNPDLEQFKRTCQPLQIPSPECKDDKFYLINPTFDQIKTARMGIINFIRKYPDEKLLIWWLISGHGGHTAGR